MTRALLLLAGLLALVLTAPAQAKPGDGVLSILTMGDSYSAGNGAGDYEGAKGCYRSDGNYASRYAELLAAAPYSVKTRETTIACSGDTTSSITSSRNGRKPQLDTLAKDHDLVLLTLGGNDLKFADIVKFCLIAKTRDGANCGSLLTQAETALENGTVRTGMTKALTAIRDTADPAAQIVLLGYPYLEGETDYTLRSGHGGSTFIEVGERLRAIQDTGEAMQEDVVRALAKPGAAELLFVSTRALFEGPPFHGLYAKKNNADRWMVQPFVDASLATRLTWYHPNPTGWEQEAELLLNDPRVLKGDSQAGGRTPGATTPPVMLVVDVSGSMGDDDGNGVTKIDGAKSALLDFVGTADRTARMGLWTYPDQTSGGCNRGRRVLQAGNVDPVRMGSEIRKLQPDGDTPTAEAMRAAAEEIAGDNGRTRNQGGTLVIVSDGESTCEDPCETAKELAGEGLNLETITVGFNISDEGREELECISGALGGRYLDIEDSDELAETLDRLARPQLEIELAATEVSVVAGGDYSDVSVTITNNADVEATNVLGQLYLGGPAQATPSAGFDVRRPVAHLGNIEPHGTINVTWQVRAAGDVSGRSSDFTVGARAANAAKAGGVTGRLKAIGVQRFDQAGQILKGPGDVIAILGDSYSAGEGAGDYAKGTDTDRNGCHRSPNTYLMPLAGKDKVRLLACSGGLTSDVWAPNANNAGEPAQADQLRKLRKVRAVVMTMGGNDAGFAKLATSCLAAPVACSKTVYLDWFYKEQAWLSRDDFVKTRLGAESGLQRSLETTYGAVNRALNNRDAIRARGGAIAPILVLGYPMMLPYDEPACAPMGVFYTRAFPRGPYTRPEYLLNRDEVALAGEFTSRLNGVVETAVETARRDDKVPVFYVPTTERAFMPRHTLCDDGKPGSSTEPFGRTVRTIIGVDTSVASAAPLLAALKASGRRQQELAHPNRRGYEEETYALLRWSVSKDAETARKELASFRPAKPSTNIAGTWPQSQVRLGPNVNVQPGSTYPLQAPGFAPGSDTRITIQSEPRLLGAALADDRGTVRTRVAIPPDMPAGRHTIVVTGAGPEGRLHTVRYPVEVDGPLRPPLPLALGAGSGVCLLLGLLVLTFTGTLRTLRGRLRGG